MGLMHDVTFYAFLYLIIVPDFVKYLGQSSQCKVEETPKGVVHILHRSRARGVIEGKFEKQLR